MLVQSELDVSGQNLVEMGIGIIKGRGLWWQRDVFLLVSLKQLPLLALCFTFCWTLLQQSSKMDQMSIAYLLQCKADELV